jgi:hypothetical protein
MLLQPDTLMNIRNSRGVTESWSHDGSRLRLGDYEQGIMKTTRELKSSFSKDNCIFTKTERKLTTEEELQSELDLV